MCFSIVSTVDVSTIADREDAAQPGVGLGRIFDDVGLEGDARPLEEDHLAGRVVVCRIAVVRVIESREVHRDADGVPARLDVLEHPRIPDALLPFAVGSVVIQIAELPDERALADARPAHDCDAHNKRMKA
jgi:hypothetical protein